MKISLSTEDWIVQTYKLTFLVASLAILANPPWSFVNYGLLLLEKKAGNMKYWYFPTESCIFTPLLERGSALMDTGSATLGNLCQTPWKSPELLLLVTDLPKWTWIKTFPPRLNKTHMPWRDTKILDTMPSHKLYPTTTLRAHPQKPVLLHPQSREHHPTIVIHCIL